jgi:hypothetical protein
MVSPVRVGAMRENIKVKIWAASLVQMWDECKRCFWRRYVLNERRPSDFGEVFDIADRAMRRRMANGGNGGWVDIGVGPGEVRVHSQGAWVESEPIEFNDIGVTIILGGQYDAIVEDQAAEHHLLDYKTSARDEIELFRYRRQLDAYRFCLEHPNRDGANAKAPLLIEEIGLLIYTPETFTFKGGISGLFGPTRWIGFARNETAFTKHLSEVAMLLAHDEPFGDWECPWCRYRAIGGQKTA